MEERQNPITQNQQPAQGAAGATSDAAAPAEEEKSYDTELRDAKNRIASLEDRFLRQAADFQNFKKRARQDRLESVEIGRVQIAGPMLGVLDDLERSLQAVEEAEGAMQLSSKGRALLDGVQYVVQKFQNELDKLGIKPMEVVGERFNEQRHEALMQQPAPAGKMPGDVLAEIQKGYTIDGRVLRHARVVVAT